VGGSRNHPTMPHQQAVAWGNRLWRLPGITFWMAQAPVFLLGFAAAGLVVRKQWIVFAILVTCVWIYARVLRQEYFVTLLDTYVSRVFLAIETRYPRRPARVEPTPPVSVASVGMDEEPVPDAPSVEPAPPPRASARTPRRVRPLDVSPTKRMLQLEELRETGLVSAAEYQDKRQEILRAI
jgi:hypothetical protein